MEKNEMLLQGLVRCTHNKHFNTMQTISELRNARIEYSKCAMNIIEIASSHSEKYKKNPYEQMVNVGKIFKCVYENIDKMYDYVFAKNYIEEKKITAGLMLPMLDKVDELLPKCLTYYANPNNQFNQNQIDTIFETITWLNKTREKLTDLLDKIDKFNVMLMIDNIELQGPYDNLYYNICPTFEYDGFYGYDN